MRRCASAPLVKCDCAVRIVIQTVNSPIRVARGEKQNPQTANDRSAIMREGPSADEIDDRLRRREPKDATASPSPGLADCTSFRTAETIKFG